MVPDGNWGSAFSSSIFTYKVLVMVSSEKK
jgi:hypothetical protein